MSYKQIERSKLLVFFAAVSALSLILRISYSGHLFQDDGLWFTAGEQILRGKALYSEIYFDKPPVLPLTYAALFKLFGAHIITIRLFTVCYSVAISGALYLFGSWLYDRRAGLMAAGMFAFFSTTSVNNHVQGLNTDLLMLLPYTLGAYLLVRACFEQRDLPALAGGVMVGVAIQTNPKGIFDLIFFVLLLLLGCWGYANKKSQALDFKLSFASAMRLFALAVIGLAAGTLPFLIYLAITHSLSDYWLSVWDWGARYASYSAARPMLKKGPWLTSVYLARNNTLFIGLLFVVAVTVRRVLQSRKTQPKQGSNADQENPRDGAATDYGLQTTDYWKNVFRSDVTLLLWIAISYAGLAVGGRFYSNYFFQILPSLCLLGARGLIGIISALKSKPAGLRRAATILIAIGFVVTAVRFHTRTAVLAADWIRGAMSRTTSGTSSGTSSGWYHEELNREERLVAAVVTDLPDGADQIERIGAEAMRVRGPLGAPEQSSDYLFVWGSRDEIYYWSGLIPASRYLSAQPLTGVPADTQHADDKSRSILSEDATAAARAQLVRDLERTRPKYIVDEIGFFNTGLSIQAYPELNAFMKNYRGVGATGRFLIYRLKDEGN